MAATLDLGNLLVHLRMNASQYMKTMNQVEARMKKASQKFTQLGRQMSLRVTVPIIAMGVASVKAFANFDDAMTKSLAIMSNITPKLRNEMENLALSISEKGVTSATDLGKAYFFLASAGLDAAQSIAALNQVNRFAIAGAFDMATATDLATDAQSALGLTVKDAQQNLVNMTRVTDVLVGANTLANATTEQFALALTSQAGPAMKAYNIELEEGIAVLAAFADQGIKAQVAGSLFGRMLRLTITGFLKNRAAWDRLNISIKETDDSLRPIADIVDDLSGALEGMGAIQKAATLQMLGFKARSQQAILPLLGLGSRIRKYNEQLKNMEGITKRVAEKQLKSFASQMKILANQIKNVGRNIGSILAPYILALNKKIKSLIKTWKNLDDRTKIWILSIAGLVAAIGPLLILLGALAGVLTLIAGITLPMVAVIAAIAIVFGVSSLALVKWLEETKKAGTGTERLKEEIESFTDVMTSSTTQIEKWIAALKNTSKEADLVISRVDRTTKQLEKIQKMRDSLKFTSFTEVKRMIESLPPFTPATTGLNLIELTEEALNRLAVIEREFLSSRKAFVDELERIDKAVNKVIEGKEPPKKFSFFGFNFETFDKVVKEWVDDAEDISTNIANAFTSGLDAISQGVTDLLFKGEADFRAIAQSIFEETTQQIIKAGIASAVGSVFGLGGGGKEGGGETELVAAQMNQATAAVNQTSSAMNQTAAAINQTSSIIDQTSSTLDQASSIMNQTAAGVNQVAGSTMVVASGAMTAAAATMLAAATINAGASAASVGHRGGMVGSIGQQRTVPASTFIGAPRFHNGLADNEFAMIAERGEVVLSKDNVAELKRNSGKGKSGGGGTVVNNFNISAIDQKGVAQFFKKNRKQIANANRRNRSENNPIRRGQV